MNNITYYERIASTKQAGNYSHKEIKFWLEVIAVNKAATLLSKTPTKPNKAL